MKNEGTRVYVFVCTQRRELALTRTWPSELLRALEKSLSLSQAHTYTQQTRNGGKINLDLRATHSLSHLD
jgi:hypothetical protein